jgi:glycosyltransferase involved in cell wall biosynthesis
MVQRDSTATGRGRPRGILIIVENLPVPFDRRVWLEATTLAKAGYRVSVISPKGKGYTQSYEMLEDVAVYRHPLPMEGSGIWGYVAEYGAALFWQFILAVRIAATRGFDVIHACNPPDLIFLVASVFKLFGKKFIFDQHDLCPELYESKFEKRGGQWRAMVLLERLTYAAADVVISTNQSYRKVAMERGGKRADRVFVVRSGPDLTRWPSGPVGDPAWRKGRKSMVGYVGVMGEQEGLDLLLMAAKTLVQDRGRADIQFVLVGDGTHRPVIEKMSADMGLADHVTFTGRLPDKALFDVLGEADVCVNPDKPSELNDKSTMNKIIEYMAFAKPIVQFDLTEGRFSAQESSLYARPGDVADFAGKIAELLDDPDRRARMGEIGRKRVLTTLSWEHQVKPLLDAYEEVFRRPAARPATASSDVRGGV